jgi:predicted O-linked N-acetylglucosamine transferase (SPINDLY family)
LPALCNGHLTFGCFNNLAKIGRATLALWAQLLHAVPDSRLLLRAVGLNDAPTCERIVGILASHGIDRERLDLLPPIRPVAAYLEGYAQVDIALDPLAYNGGTTSFEALWQGVPVLTLPGAGFCARMGAGINATAGLEAFTARDREHFLSIARDWNSRREELAELRAGLRQRLAATPLFDGARFMPAFETALREALTQRVAA